MATIKKDELKELLKKRSGVTAAREVVKPVNLYGKEKPITEGKKRVRGAKNMKKFASYVTAKSYKKLKLIAVRKDRKMYDVIQDAIDNYIKTFAQNDK